VVGPRTTAFALAGWGAACITGNCSLTARQLARGVYTNVIATYNSDTTYAKSTSSPPQTLTVNRR
jgi:hypothetical protein